MTSQETRRPTWRIVGTSAAGSKHLAMDMPCQDAFHCKELEDGTLVVAVSDGAGSAPKAKEGSAFVSEKAIVFLEEAIDAVIPSDEKGWKVAVRFAFVRTREALEKLACKSGTPFRDYSATLILAVITDEWVIGGMAGDCAAVALTECGELFSLCKPQKGEYANMTNFITHRELEEILDIQSYREKAAGIAVISDGLAELALNISNNNPCTPFFFPLFSFTKAVQSGYESVAEEKLAAFLGSDRVNARTDDDKTLVMAVKI